MCSNAYFYSRFSYSENPENPSFLSMHAQYSFHIERDRQGCVVSVSSQLEVLLRGLSSSISATVPEYKHFNFGEASHKKKKARS